MKFQDIFKQLGNRGTATEYTIVTFNLHDQYSKTFSKKIIIKNTSKGSHSSAGLMQSASSITISLNYMQVSPQVSDFDVNN
jgi:hypothetical protein